MSPGIDFTVVDARARGLQTHLAAHADLVRLTQAGALGSVVHTLNRTFGLVLPLPEAASPEAVEAAVRQTAGAHLRTLARWAHGQPGLVEVLFSLEDRRSCRALLRGAIQGAPSSARLAGLVPTPRLPSRALEVLARCATPRDVAAHLLVLHHPDAPTLVPLASQAQPGLLELELALLRGSVGRLRRAGQAGDTNLRAFLGDQVDLGNAQTAMLVAGAPLEVDPAASFVEGGRALDLATFRAAAGAATAELAAQRLARQLGASSLGREGLAPVATLERRALKLSLSQQRTAARRDPLGSAPLLEFLLRLRAWCVDLSRAIWGAALGAGPSILEPELVTPWN